MRKPLLAAIASIALLSLAACSGSADDSSSPSASAPSASSSSSATAPSGSPSASAAASAAPSAGGTPTCATSGLRVTLRSASGGGAAGSSYQDVLLRNVGDSTCAMTGWPGVSYVSGSDGRQVGAAADRQGSPAVIRLGAGRSADARLQVASPGDFENCRATSVRGLRVYPPNQKDAVFVSMPTRACASTSAHQLRIQPVRLVG